MTRNEPKTPLQCALKYLAFRSRTESEVHQKLVASGFSEEEARSALTELKSHNLLNDESLASDWTQLKAKERGYGPLFVERELLRRGVAMTIIERVLSETFGEGQEVERAAELVSRRFEEADLSDIKTLKRAEALLIRRGYSRSVITAVLAGNFQEAGVEHSS